MRLFFNKCRVCGQAHDVGAPHKFGKAADVRRSQSSQLTPEAIETLSSAFNDISPTDIPPTPAEPITRLRGRPKKIK